MGTRAIAATGSRTSRCERDQRAVERQQQLAQVDQNAQTHVPNGIGHCSADTDRSVVHHNVGELEHHFAEALAQVQHGCALGLAHPGQCDAEENGEDRDLQNLSFRDRFRDIFREDMQQEVVPVRRRNGRERCGGSGRGGNGKTYPSLRKIDRDETDNQRERGEDFEVDERFDAHPTDGFQVAVACDSRHQRGEDERRNDGLDQAQEDVREDAQVRGEGWRIEAKLGSRNHGDEDPRRERSPATGETCKKPNRHPAKDGSRAKVAKPREQAAGKKKDGSCGDQGGAGACL